MKPILGTMIAATLFYSVAAFSKSVEVNSAGTTFDEAKRKGLTAAIERVTGVLVIGEQEVSNGQITRDYMGSYSSGWINDYELLEYRRDVNGYWFIRMRVDVKDSKIKSHSAQRNTLKGSIIDGVKQVDIIDSQLNQRQQGDNLLDVIFRNYPENAYVVNYGQNEFYINRNRQPYLTVNYNLTMSPEWIDALKESLSAIATDEKNCNTLSMVVADGLAKNNGNQTKKLMGKVCGSGPDVRVFAKNSKDWFPQANSYYLADDQTLMLVNSYLQPSMGQQHLGLTVDFLDGAGAVLERQCFKVNNELLINYSAPSGVYNYNQQRQLSRPNIMGQNQLTGSVRLAVTNRSLLENLVKIKLGVQKTC